MFASDRDATVRMKRLSATPLGQVGGSPGRSSSVSAIRRAFSRRELLGLLIRRDLKSRYKDSTLGFFWSTAKPLIQLAIYFVVMGQFLQAAKNIPDFAIYVFAGLSAIGLFTEIVTGATSSILSNGGLVKKVYLPREIFPLSSVGAALFNFCIQLAILIGATFLVGKPPFHLQFLYFIPALLVLVVYATAFGLLFSAVNVYLRDTQYLVEVVTMLLFWASPVVYSWEMVKNLVTQPVLLELYTNNPLTLAVLGFQRAFWVAGESHMWPGGLMMRLAIALVVGLALLALCHRAFIRLQGNFAQEL